MHDKADLEDWLFLFDANDELISSHRKVKLNATEVRMAVRYASRISPVDAVAVIHGRQIETHQIRACFVDVRKGDPAGLVIRDKDLIWSDPTRKDVELLQKATSAEQRGG